LPSARPAIATDQPAQQGMLVEESRLCPLRPRSQFVFLAACGTRPCCSRWRAASTRTLELLRYLAASKRPAAPHMVMGHAGAVAAVQRSKASFVGLSAGGPLQQRTTQYVCCRSYRQGGDPAGSLCQGGAPAGRPPGNSCFGTPHPQKSIRYKYCHTGGSRLLQCLAARLKRRCVNCG
jgi:hypothetical protein